MSALLSLLRDRFVSSPVSWAVVALAVVVGACSSDGVGRDGERIVDGGDESVFELRPGDCLDPPEAIDENVGELPAVPCSQLHTHEVFAVWEAGDPDAFAGAGDELDVDVYPGEADLDSWAERACIASFPDYVGAGYFDSDLFSTYLLPTLDSWSEDDREVVCLARTTGWKMERSVHCSGGQRGALEVPAEAIAEGAEGDDDVDAAYPVAVEDPCPDLTTSTGS